MEQRQNRTSMMAGIGRMVKELDFRGLRILYALLQYLIGEEE